MIKQEKLHFSTNAKLEKLIGRELITNNIIAVFELIKNSYDAFAKEVTIEFIDFLTTGKDIELAEKKNVVISTNVSKIIISDNGNGMSFKEIKENWMEIGTVNKENIITKTDSRSRTTRVINGEKGIGRFGADKLGSLLKMRSVGNDGWEKSTIVVDWDVFDDHNKLLQDVSFDCSVEQLAKNDQTGVSLEISNLRDKWTGKDVINLKKQLKKMISPFVQEQAEFNIYLKFKDYQERIVNDSFEYADTGIEVTLDEDGKMKYKIFDNVNQIDQVINTSSPSFGPISLKVLYMDAAAKRSFARKNSASTREYGNIKLFRDNFRILPYGEMENDWLGIDNKHAQAVFRTLGTRDIIGYVQISKAYNPKLKDATNRQGLNEDTDEFEDFKNFIWTCLELLQEYIFNKIKTEAEKEGRIIQNTVNEIKEEFVSFKQSLPKIYEEIQIPDIQKKELINKTLLSFNSIEQNINQVEKANKQLVNRLVVMEKIVGAENMLYDLLHAVKNKLDTLDAMVASLSLQAENLGLDFEDNEFNRISNEISKMIVAALKRTSPARRKKEVVILADILESFISEKRMVYPDVKIELVSKNYSRIKCDIDGLNVVFDNLMNNSIKALKEKTNKLIRISMAVKHPYVVVYFEDNGIGIKDDHAPFIFNVTFTRTGGTGLGLATVYQYMKEQNGDVAYVKNSLLGGAMFELDFPIV